MSAPFHDPYWPRASTLLEQDAADATVALIGIPLHLASLSSGRCDLAPTAIRAALAQFSCFDVENGIDLQKLRLRDAGDLDVAALTPETAFSPIVDRLRELRRQASLVIALGGDNSVTRPLAHASGARLVDTGLITLDAHFDLRSTAGGLSNGNPVSALLEDGLPGPNIAQIGIQSFANSGHYAAVARDAGIHTVTMEQARKDGIAAVVAKTLQALGNVHRIVVDFDLDVLDRLWMPAAPGSRPGGMTPMELFEAAFALGGDPRITAADFVELDPARDASGVSGLNAARCLLAFLAGFVSRTKPQLS